MRTAEQSDWHTKPMLPKRSAISFSRQFSPREIERMRYGLVPEPMEDKWFVDGDGKGPSSFIFALASRHGKINDDDSYSFYSSFNEVKQVKIDSVTCEVDGMNLW